MTPQEQQMLQSLTERINSTQLAEKDPEAEQYLKDTMGRNPDAMYILAQTTLVQQYALDQAQKQLTDARAQIELLRQQPPPPKKSTSFLGSLLGHDDPPPPQQPQYTPVPNYAPAGSYYSQQNAQQNPPQYGPPQQYGAPQYGAQYAPPSQTGSFLRSAATTAAGVAAGAIAFEGIESLLHGFGGHNSGYGMGSFGGGGGRPEEIVNNYYGDSGPRDHGGLSSDIEDRRGDTRQFAGGDGDTYGHHADDVAIQDTADTTADGDYGADSSSNDFGSDDSGSDGNYGSDSDDNS